MCGVEDRKAADKSRIKHFNAVTEGHQSAPDTVPPPVPPFLIQSFVMLALTYIPRPPLSGFVERFWLFDGYGEPHSKERALPTGAVDVVINLRGKRLHIFDREDAKSFQSFDAAVVCGAHATYFVHEAPSKQSAVLGIHFKPGGACAFLKCSAGELRNGHEPLNVIWGRAGDELRNRLIDMKDAQERFEIVEQFLLKQMVRPDGMHPVVASALRGFQTIPQRQRTAETARRRGMSERQFIQLFRDQIGLAPKEFCRVQRFQAALAMTGRLPAVDWTNVAITCGYYDQAHLINEFQDFAGIGPTAYLAQRGRHQNHVAQPA
jgi:AraC-like DNA-binding protein